MKIRFFPIQLVGFLGLLISTNAWAVGYGRGEWSGHMWGPGMIFGPLMMIGFIVLIIYLIVLFTRRITGSSPGHSGPAHQSAQDILSERFAKGEIDRDEFEGRRRILSE